MPDRDLMKLHPEVRRRALLIDMDWRTHEPKQPRLIVSEGWRDSARQAQLWRQGRETAGKKVTNSPPGTSLHEYGLAVDFAFIDDARNKAVYDETPEGAARFDRLGLYIRKYGLEWGGDWPPINGKDRSDRPHAQAPGITWQQAKAGVEPVFPALPEPAEGVATC